VSTQSAILVDRTILITGCLILAALCLLSAVVIIVLLVKLSRAEGRGRDYRRMKGEAREVSEAWGGAHVIFDLIERIVREHATNDPARAVREIQRLLDSYRRGRVDGDAGSATEPDTQPGT
jgi:hypothetical protein